MQSTVCAVHDSQVANAWGSSRDLRSTLPFCQCLSLVKDRLEQAVHCFIGFLSPWDLHHFKLHDSSWLSTKVRETYQVRTLPSKDFAETFVEVGERRHWSISPAYHQHFAIFHHYFITISSAYFMFQLLFHLTFQVLHAGLETHGISADHAGGDPWLRALETVCTSQIVEAAIEQR